MNQTLGGKRIFMFLKNTSILIKKNQKKNQYLTQLYC